MPAKQLSINLLDQDALSQSALGKVLLWALSIGRYIVVFTELIVILSFLSRFKLDRDLTDLNDAVATQKAIIKSYGDLEERFNFTQDQIAFIKEMTPVISPITKLDLLGKSLPQDVKVTKIGLRDVTLSLNGLALSDDGFIQLLKALKHDELVDSLTLGNVVTKSASSEIEFDLRIDFTES
jgi:Tfp pilus assembly protein PilN